MRKRRRVLGYIVIALCLSGIVNIVHDSTDHEKRYHHREADRIVSSMEELNVRALKWLDPPPLY
jgi:hypothetical protein